MSLCYSSTLWFKLIRWSDSHIKIFSSTDKFTQIFIDDRQSSLRCYGETKAQAAPFLIRYSADIFMADILFFTPLCLPRAHNICLQAAHQPHGNCSPKLAWWLTLSKRRFLSWIQNSRIIHQISHCPILGLQGQKTEAFISSRNKAWNCLVSSE